MYTSVTHPWTKEAKLILLSRRVNRSRDWLSTASSMETRQWPQRWDREHWICKMGEHCSSHALQVWYHWDFYRFLLSVVIILCCMQKKIHSMKEQSPHAMETANRENRTAPLITWPKQTSIYMHNKQNSLQIKFSCHWVLIELSKSLPRKQVCVF